MKNTHPQYLRHNNVQLIQGGRSYFDLLIQMLDDAKESIHLQTYIFDEDETGIEVATALVRAAQRGVKVYVLLDGYGSQHLSATFIDGLIQAGIVLRKFRPMFKSKRFYLGRRLHHKLVVVDSLKCTVGGLNISNRYNDTDEGPAWLDWALYVEGETAAALEDVCKSRMRLRYKNEKKPADKPIPIENECRVRISVNDWVRRKRQVYDSYLEMIRGAKSEITIMSAYFLPGRQFRKSLADAIRRGVNVTIIATGNADIFLMKYAERFIYQWLFKHKIRVYEYRKSVLHAKLAICDDNWMTIGSFNINNLSAFASIELNLDVANENCVAGTKKRIEDIIEHDCVQVTEAKFNKKYNGFNKAVHRWAYHAFRFLFFISTKQTGDR